MAEIKKFATEHYFARYEFSAPHLLSVSDCETLTIDELLAVGGVSIAEFGRVPLGYTESQGHPELRAAVAQRYKRVRPDDVVVLGSPVEGIFVAIQALLEADGEAIVLTPVYDALLNVAEEVARRAHQWPLNETPTGWDLDWSKFESLLNEKTRVLIVNFPHNPTGFLPTSNHIDRLLEVADRKDLWILCDEMYRGLELHGRKSLPSLADRYDKTIVLSGLSKTLGLAGLRSGWLVVRDESMRNTVMNWKFYTSICPPAPTEFLTLAALKAYDELIKRNRERIESNLSLAESFFARHTNRFAWRVPEAGSVALVKLLGEEARSATDYCHRLAADAGIVLLPSRCLSHGDEHVRFGFGRDGFPAALDAYERYLNDD